jgi:para-nitrobenzyl esterase
VGESGVQAVPGPGPGLARQGEVGRCREGEGRRARLRDQQADEIDLGLVAVRFHGPGHQRLAQQRAQLEHRRRAGGHPDMLEVGFDEHYPQHSRPPAGRPVVFGLPRTLVRTTRDLGSDAHHADISPSHLAARARCGDGGRPAHGLQQRIGEPGRGHGGPEASTADSRYDQRSPARDRDRDGPGVPWNAYAQPPTGARRWTMPVAPPRPSGTVQATKPGPSCAQAGSAPGASATSSASEDCLFLNVTTPKTMRAGHKLPVMVWWHGGGYTSGSGSAYDAQRLASRGHVIVVTVNYRLGVFGYLSLPGLPGSGDFGLADQILATRWAKSNAAAFGGDPGNITVFGESSGAMSACALLTSPQAKGLVDKVAMSSGGTCQLSWPKDGLVPSALPQTPYVDLADGQKLGVAEAKTLGCAAASALSCLRGKPVKALLKIFPLFSDVLAYNTPLLPANPATAVQSGLVLDIPVLSSGNHDEERAFVGGAQKVKPFFTAKTYPAYLKAAFGAGAAKVARQYPLSAYPNAATAWATLITDVSWACPTLAGNAALAAHGSAVYGAEFDDPNAPDVNMVATKTFKPGATHASDIPYLFDLTGKNLLRGTASRPGRSSPAPAGRRCS